MVASGHRHFKNEHNHKTAVIIVSNVGKQEAHDDILTAAITSGIINMFTVYSDWVICVMLWLRGVMHFMVFAMFIPTDCNL